MSDAPISLNRLVAKYLWHRELPPSGRARVLHMLASCRTENLGGRAYECNSCGEESFVWNSCENRHCPTCMGGASREWMERQQEYLLPVPYFHVVFTLPREVSELALYNKKALYGLLMRVSAEVLRVIGGDKKFLDGQLGFLSVLHTWTQKLDHHPHVHIIVPGGALSKDGLRWNACKPNFFLPVRVLSALFRRLFLEGVVALRARGGLRFQGSVAKLHGQLAWDQWLSGVKKKDWVVYAKRPFGGPEQVLKYLSRYTHRVAISNGRLVSFEDGVVTFSYRKSLEPYERGELRLSLNAFIDRFCLHILPQGFVRIRAYGFLSARGRAAHLEKIRALLGVVAPEELEGAADEELVEADDRPCTKYGVGILVETREIRSLLRKRATKSKPPIATTGPPGTIEAMAVLERMLSRAA